MAQNQEPQKNGKNQKVELDPDTIKAIVAQKGQELQIEAQKLKLDEKRLDQDGKLAERSMEINSELIKAYPRQHRKTIVTYGIFVSIIILIVLGFIAYCIEKGNQEFAKQFLTVITHTITLVAGIFVGRQSNKKKAKAHPSSNEPEEVEIID